MNSAKVRIYELSRELNLENKDILAVCEQLDIAAKSHSSTITEAEAQRIRTTAEEHTSNHSSGHQTDSHRHGPVTPRRKNGIPQPVGQRKPQILEVRKLQARPEFPVEDISAKATATEPSSAPRPLGPPVRPTRATTRELAPPAPSTVSGEDADKVDSEPSLAVKSDKSELKKPKLELAGPPTKPAAPASTPQPTLTNRPTLRSAKQISAPGKNSEDRSNLDQDRSSDPVQVVKPPTELRRPQLVRPHPTSSSDRHGTDTSNENRATAKLELAEAPEDLLLNRPIAPTPVRVPKRTSLPDEEEEGQELAGKKAGTKVKRRQPEFDEDEEEDFQQDINATTVVDVSQSLLRPLKPKAAKQAKPAATIARPSAPSKDKKPSRGRDRRTLEETPERPEKVVLTSDLTVQELAAQLAIPETEIIKVLFFKGIAANINQTLDIPTASMVAQELGFEVETAEQESQARKVTEMLDVEDLENLQPRPPVVTIMGHVDHGKTTLLDAIRQTKVAQGEAGGITQHIGAYHVDVEHEGQHQQIVFLDTPGHEAFTAMRARGARVTDIAVLVVAADDGVRPQTVEAISHARAAGVPIVVAINKVDKEGAQTERVKQELTEYNLVPEEWGGDTIMVPVSAIQKENLDTLLEMLLLVSEVEDLQANPDRPAKGTVIEAHLDKARGPVATLLVQNGTLRVGDTLVAGSTLGKVRAMVDDRGQRVAAAGPSFAVEVLGLGDVPAAGDDFESFQDEKEARAIAAERTDQQRQSRLQQAMASRRVSLSALSDQAREGELKELNLLLKADVQGSVEAILGALEQLPQKEVQVRVLLAAPGEITETDVDLASASDAVIVGFNTTLASGARQAADRAGVDIREYNIIYKLLEDIEGAMEGLLEPELVEEALGQAEVRAVFPVGRGAVAGCYVLSGKLVRNCKVRVRRNGSQVHEGILDSLKRMKEDTREVNAGYECGVGLDNFQAWAEGDLIEAFRMVTKRRKLSE